MIKILIVDDDRDIRLLLSTYLKNEGYDQLFFAESAAATYQFLNIGKTKSPPEIDLIILDIVLGDKSGLELCRKIKQRPDFEDIPIIIITAKTNTDYLKQAFSAGATDFIRKPINKIEFMARVKSVLRLRKEMQKRKQREEELMETSEELRKANKKLEQMASVDGLTGLANRRLFDEMIEKEYRRANREREYISLLMIDIDNFKDFNDTYGHQAGDDCLKKVAKAIDNYTRRPGDLAARYGGEEFSVILPATDKSGALTIAENIRKGILDLNINHEKSDVSDFVTVSVGVTSLLPEGRELKEEIEYFIKVSDVALYRAKETGRNRVIYKNSIDHEVIKNGKM